MSSKQVRRANALWWVPRGLLHLQVPPECCFDMLIGGQKVKQEKKTVLVLKCHTMPLTGLFWILAETHALPETVLFWRASCVGLPGSRIISRGARLIQPPLLLRLPSCVFVWLFWESGWFSLDVCV